MPALRKVIDLWFMVCRKKQGSTTNYQLPTTNKKGFSLVEVLVALGIIAILGAVAVPNLRNFSSSQEIDTTASQVANILKTAQSSAISRIKCPNGDTTNTYIVRLTSINYSLVALCDLSSEQIINIYPSYSPQGATGSSSTFTGNISVCSGQTTDVIFEGSKINYHCIGTDADAPQTGDIVLTLKNASNSLCKKVKIEEGGVIKVEEGYVCN